MSRAGWTVRRAAVVGSVVLAASGLCACAGGQPPDLSGGPLEGLVSSRAERKAIADCLTDHGWPVQYQDGQILVQIDPAQDEAYDRDTAACTDEFGIDLDGQLGPEGWDRAYEWSSELAECLVEHGWQVPERPTRQAFESTYDTEPWLPWSLVPNGELHAAGEQCPSLYPAQ